MKKPNNRSTTIEYDTLLEKVIYGIKNGIPIYKTLKKYNYDRGIFYRKTSPNTLRYFNELKCLKKSKRGKGASKIYVTDIANFKII